MKSGEALGLPGLRRSPAPPPPHAPPPPTGIGAAWANLAWPLPLGSAGLREDTRAASRVGGVRDPSAFGPVAGVGALAALLVALAVRRARRQRVAAWEDVEQPPLL